MTDEERRVFNGAVEVARSYVASASVPMKVDCIEMRCHPDDEQAIRALYDAPIVTDSSLEPGTISVTPFAYAKRIDVEIGFVQPEDKG